MMKLAPEWVRTSDPVIRSPARYRWTTAPARSSWSRCLGGCYPSQWCRNRPTPVPSDLEQLLQWLLGGTQAPQPAPPVRTGITKLETLLQNLLPVSPTPDSLTQPGPGRREWAAVLCFSCGKPGYGATRCRFLSVRSIVLVLYVVMAGVARSLVSGEDSDSE